MYERILTPLDGSQLAELTLPSVELMAARLGSEITVLHVDKTAEDSSRNIHQSYLDKTIEGIKSGIQKYRKGQETGEIKVQAVNVVGDPAEVIVDYADKNDIRLIIMATHGRSGLTRWMLGSVAERVVRATHKPVLLVRVRRPRDDVSPGHFPSKGTLLVCLDGSPESECILPHAEELATRLRNLELVLFEALPTGHFTVIPGGYDKVAHLEEQMAVDRVAAEDYLGRIVDGLKKKGIDARFEVRFGNDAEEIILFADELRADAVAMSTHGRSGIARWALGSVADRVLRRGNTPLLLVRPHGKSGDEAC